MLNHLSKSCGPVLLLIRTITQFVADEIPEPTRRPHCVARCQGKSEKKIEIIFVLLRKPKSMMNRSKRKLNLTQSGILERAGAFQLGVTLHERRSAFCRCYCTNAYAKVFLVRSTLSCVKIVGDSLLHPLRY